MIPFGPSSLERAANAFNTGDLRTAEALCQESLRTNPKGIQAWVLLSRIRTRQARWPEAEDALRKAQQLAPQDAEVLFSLAILRMRQGRFGDGIPLLEQARRGAPGHPGIRCALASCLVETGQAKQALAAIGAPNSADTHLAFALAQLALRDDAAAEPSLRATIASGQNAAARYQANQLLGQVLERRGDFAGAFAAFAAARAVVPLRYDIAEMHDHVRRLIETFSESNVARFATASNTSRRPVFIAGMPRSGTTLIEKMIASHPQGAGAGETDALRRQVDIWAAAKPPARGWPEIVGQLGVAQLDAVATGYLGATDAYAGPGIERVADKHLRNWLHVGLVALAFPQATIIHIRRDPFDTGLSCFERLHPQAMPWSASLEHVGEVLALNERLMAHWHRVFPGRIVDVVYEDLARDPARVLPPVIEAIGLPWNEACLRQHERKARPGAQEPPPTFSADQVKRPVYDSSIGRAERYGSLLDPMRAAYAARGR